MLKPYSTHWSVGKRKKPLQIWSRISCVLNAKVQNHANAISQKPIFLGIFMKFAAVVGMLAIPGCQ